MRSDLYPVSSGQHLRRRRVPCACTKEQGSTFDTEFTGDVPETITYHAPCHLRAQNIGLKSRDLMKLTGAKISLVNRCSGIDGTWGVPGREL